MNELKTVVGRVMTEPVGITWIDGVRWRHLVLRLSPRPLCREGALPPENTQEEGEAPAVGIFAHGCYVVGKGDRVEIEYRVTERGRVATRIMKCTIDHVQCTI